MNTRMLREPLFFYFCAKAKVEPARCMAYTDIPSWDDSMKHYHYLMEVER